MPSYFTAKEERQYRHIKKSCLSSKRYCKRKGKACTRTCMRIAAATVNKYRGTHGLGKIKIERVRVNRKGYDRHGTYWGVGAERPEEAWHVPLYRAFDTSTGAETYTRAHSAPSARAHVREWIATQKKRARRGLGVVRGKCCVVRGKKRVACFHSKKDAVALKRSLRGRGFRIRCV